MNRHLKWVQALLAVAVLGLLAGGWGYLYSHSHVVDSQAQGLVLQGLRDLKQLDAEWTADVLRSHTDVNTNYDALTAPLQPLADTLDQLAQTPEVAHDPALQQRLAQLRQVIDEKALLVDRFKAQNSLYKNSLRYIPTGEKEIQGHLIKQREAGQAAGASAAKAASKAMSTLEQSLGSHITFDADARERMERALAQLRGSVAAVRAADSAAHATAGIADIAIMQAELGWAVSMALHYTAVPDEDTARRLQAQIDRLRTSVPRYPEEVRELVENLLSHLSTVLRLRDLQTQVLREVSRLPIAPEVDAMSAGLARHFEQELQTQFRYQRWLLAYSAVALALIVLATGFIFYRGVGERRRLNEQVRQKTMALQENEVHLVHAQKMSAIGELSAGLAHEVNTPLAAVKSGLQSLAELLVDVKVYVLAAGDALRRTAAGGGAAAPVAPDVARSLQTASEAGGRLEQFDTLQNMDELLQLSLQSVDHISRVVVNMLDFSRLDRADTSAVRLEDGIDATLMICSHLLRKVKVAKAYGDTPEVECSPAQINQVVLNLVKNAADAMPAAGGELRVATRSAEGDRVEIEVADNGRGIPPEVLPRIWDPFFTTKPQGVGTGLGLSTCRKIVQAHGGDIRVESQPGRGTVVVVSLPVRPPPARRAGDVQRVAAARLASA